MTTGRPEISLVIKTSGFKAAGIGKIVAGTMSAAFLMATVSMRAQTVDAFDPDANGAVRSIAVLTNSQIFIGGTFTSVAGTTRNRAALLNSNGTLVNSFNPSANERILASVVQADGKIMIGGGFTSVGGQSRAHLARLSPDGSLDTNFTTVANNWVWALAQQADGKILVGGIFTTLGGQTRNYLARLNANGSLDMTFNPGANGQVNTIAVQPDGGILFGGFFTNLGGQARNFIGRISENGMLDNMFNPGASNVVWKLALQEDGGIIVGGLFNGLAGQIRTNLGRLNVNGLLDGPFDPAPGGTVNSIVIQPDGKIVVGGNFTSLRGLSRSSIGRLHADGSLDPDFDPGANATLYSLALQPDGGILIGGEFTQLGGQPRNRIARLAPALNITRHPRSQRAVVSSDVVFDVTVVGSMPIHYQWRKNDFEIPGATNAEYRIRGVQLTDAGNYNVLVQDASGGLVSSTALLEVQLIANDDFANAIPLTGVSNRVMGTSVGATLEPGEDPFQGGTVWWVFAAPENGRVTITKGQGEPSITIYGGDSVSNLFTIANDRRGTPPISVRVCRFSFGVTSNELYYISASGPFVPFEFQFEFQPDAARPLPPNDRFAQASALSETTDEGSSTTVAAGYEPGEPAHGYNSIWWSWTAQESGPVVVTTSGSRIDTSLYIYTGSSVCNLTIVTSNGDAFHWGLSSGPPSDPLSRVRFEAAAGTTYSIAVTGGSGEVRVNVERVALESILSFERTPRPDNSVDFSAQLQISNFRSLPTGPLRVRLVARPGYTYREDVFFRCPDNWPVFNAPDEELEVFDLPAPGTLPSLSSTALTITGRCPPSLSFNNWAVAKGVIAFLEEDVDGVWQQMDSRLILNGDWPGVGGFTGGPGGGVVNIVSSLVAGADNPGLLHVRPGPPAALRLGGAWRVSPTNYGEKGELRFYTNFTSASLKLPVSSTNFAIEVRELAGFLSPPGRTVFIQPNVTVPLDLVYRVNPPRLLFDSTTGLAISGTEGTAYSIESTPSLSSPSVWSPSSTVTLGPGTSLISSSVPATGDSNRFYRAKWLVE